MTEVASVVERNENASSETEQNRENYSPSVLLSKVVWLMMKSPQYKHQFIADLEWSVMPAFARRQFRLFHKNGQPFAYVSWALVNDEVASRMDKKACASSLKNGTAVISSRLLM
nr:toxin-activating lysine-acyltransferase [Salidesulfovibrio onnuriiensis]